MTDVYIFVVGFVVMLLVCGAVGFFFWAAVEDGKYNREQKAHDAGKSASNSQST